MKSVAYIVLQSYAYYNKLVVKYFCTTTNFWRTYIHAYSDLSNFEQVQSLVIFIAFIPKTLTKGQILGTMFVILSMILEFLNWINGIEKRLTDLTVSLNRIQTSSYNLKTHKNACFKKVLTRTGNLYPTFKFIPRKLICLTTKNYKIKKDIVYSTN